MGTLDRDNAQVAALLKTVRDNPLGAASARDDVLGPIHAFLLGVTASEDAKYHWFCDKASQLTVEAASFLLRLFAYNSVLVIAWKERLTECLHGCPRCIQGFEVAKVSSRSS